MECSLIGMYSFMVSERPALQHHSVTVPVLRHSHNLPFAHPLPSCVPCPRIPCPHVSHAPACSRTKKVGGEGILFLWALNLACVSAHK